MWFVVAYVQNADGTEGICGLRGPIFTKKKAEREKIIYEEMADRDGIDWKFKVISSRNGVI